MKNTVSFETASRLKAAGFPQPEPESGQVWYPNDVNMCVFVVRVGGRVVNHVNQGYTLVYNTPASGFKSACIFAPTATDILREFPDCICLYAILIKGEIYWCAAELSLTPNHGEYCSPLGISSPAEAAALAWLEIHEKNAFTPNARIKFKREQTIECYDENGKQNLLVIGKGKEYDAVLEDMKATIKSSFGPVEFRLSNDDIVFIGWL